MNALGSSILRNQVKCLTRDWKTWCFQNPDKLSLLSFRDMICEFFKGFTKFIGARTKLSFFLGEIFYIFSSAYEDKAAILCFENNIKNAIIGIHYWGNNI